MDNQNLLNPELDELNFNKLKLKHSLNIEVTPKCDCNHIIVVVRSRRDNDHNQKGERDICNNKGSILEIDDDQISVDEGQSNFLRTSRHETEIWDPNILKLCSGFKKEDNDSLSDSEEDLEPFDLLARKMEDISPCNDGGVLKMELEPGVGGDLPKRAQVLFHYNAYLEFADEPFDSTFLRNKPHRARLDQDDTLYGIKIGLRSMRKSEKSRFLVKPQYGFGEQGCPPRVPGNTTIMYVITLLDAVDYAAAEDFDNFSYSQRHMASFQDKLEAAKAHDRRAKANFKDGNLAKARKGYRDAAWVLDSMHLKDETEEKVQSEMLFKMHSNLAQVYLDLKEPARACTECRLALETVRYADSDAKAKVFYRFGKAKMLLNDFDSARKYTAKARSICPNNEAIRVQSEQILKREENSLMKEKLLCRKMFSSNEENKNIVDYKSAGSSNPVKKDDRHDPSSTNILDHIVSDSIDEELQSTYKRLVRQFYSNTSIEELALPPRLSPEEVNFVTELANALSLTLKKTYVDQSIMWKVTRS